MPNTDSTTPSSPRRTTGSIAASIGAELIGPSDLTITGVDSLEHAGPSSLTFIRSGKYASRWAASDAAAALVTRGIVVEGHDPTRRALLIVDNADAAMIVLLRLFTPAKPRPMPGVHPTAIVDPTAIIGQGVHVGAYCCIGAGTTVGDGAVLWPQVFLGDNVSIGAITTLHTGVKVLDGCTVGSACALWPNVVIGADGFGYIAAPDGRGLLKIPHVGGVTIGDGVEIGAGSCVDRGKFGQTTIGDGTKIDNLVQIGHNVRIGRGCIVCGMTGLAGSVTLGDGVVLAGGVGITDNVTIGSRATVTAKSAVMCSIPPGQVWFGYPARPHLEHKRAIALMYKLPALNRAVRAIQQRLGMTEHGDEAPANDFQSGA
jgi:UDP-3-O-[3-hydroxymyristoyl] glucosamine N-acyltransferase